MNNNNFQNDKGDISPDFDFVKQLIQYSMMAAYRETAHSINNLLTSLSIQQSMVKNHLKTGNLNSALERMENLERSLQKMVDFSRNIASKIEIISTVTEADMNQVISQTIRMSERMIENPRWTVRTRLCPLSRKYKTDVTLIKILIFTYLSSCHRLYDNPEIFIESDFSPQPDTFTIRGSVERFSSISEGSGNIPRQSGGMVGEIPLVTMKRIIQSLSSQAELTIPDVEKNNFVFTLKLT